MPTTRRFVSLLVLATAPLLAQEKSADDVVADAKRRLAAIGFQVPAGVGTTPRKSAEVIKDIDAQQDLLLPANAFLIQHALLGALGRPAGRNAAVARRQAVLSMARGLSAYYDPLQKTFVLLPSTSRALSEALAGSLLPLVTHELVHACQDARDGGIPGFIAAAPLTLDAAKARRCVMEGEAEIAALVALDGEASVRALATSVAVNSLSRMLAGELTGVIYDSGRRLAALRFVADGWPGLLSLWQQPPTSTEQVLHPEKLGRDLPQDVPVPAVDGFTIESETVLGELMTYHLLRQLGGTQLDGALATTGWDGDRVVVLEHVASKATVVLWRSVWDRPVDAQQFAAALARSERGRTTVTGRAVDWVVADDAAHAALVTAACTEQAVPGDEVAADGASTAAAEEELRAAAAQSAIVDGRWQLTNAGVSIPVPAGFELQEVQGVKRLVHTASSAEGFTVNVNVQVTPQGPIADLEAMLALDRTQFEAFDEITIDRLEIGRSGETPVIHVEYHGRFPGLPAMHGLQLQFLRDGQQVVVTASSGLSQWSRYEEVLRALMADVRIDAK